MKKTWAFETFYDAMRLVRGLPLLIGYFVSMFIFIETGNLYTILYVVAISLLLFFITDTPLKNWMHGISGWTIEEGFYIPNTCKDCPTSIICVKCTKRDFWENSAKEDPI